MQIEKVGFWPWFLQRVSAIYLVFGMTVHMFILPLTGKTIDYNMVHSRLESACWIVFDVLLLIACLYHGFNGLWAIVLDYDPRGLWRKGIGYLIAIVGLAFFVYGLIALIPLAGG
mgnify:CR=1 FL=1